jgi:hypothetical protein
MNTSASRRISALMHKTSAKVGVAVLAATAATALLAGPASAVPAAAAAPAAAAVAGPGCTFTFTFDLIEGQIDNCPGNGSTSWAWLYVPNGGNAITGWLDTGILTLTFTDGSTATFSTSAPSTDTQNYSKTISAVRLSENLTTFNGLPVFRGSDTTTVPGA